MGRRPSLVLTAVAAILLIVGLTAAYVRFELADPERFGDRAVEALRTDEVRSVIAEQVVVELLEQGSPELVASRPLALTAVEAILQTEEFGTVFRRSAITANELLLAGDQDVIVELEGTRAVLVTALEGASPELASQVPSDLRPRIASIRDSDAATWTVRTADAASAATIPLLIAACGAIMLATALAPDRRRLLISAGGMLAAGAVLGLFAMAALRGQVVSGAEQVGVLSRDDARAAVGATWDAFAGDLERWLVAVGVAGVGLAAGVLLAQARIDRAAALRGAAEIVAGGSLPRPVRLLRGLVLAALGALVLVGAEPLLTTTVALVGGALVLLGLAEAASTIPRPAQSTASGGRRRLRAGLVAAAALAAAGVLAANLLLDDGGPASPPPEEEITACNGMAALCDRRLDEVALPGTHNSMSAADRPGWFFANQMRPIPEQLADGIRLLMIDPHYGVVDARGRVRTDLEAEGTNRNRVARRLGPDTVRVAERLAGRLGLVPAEGEREIFLCHTLCELGAERMSSTLDEIRGFLERNRAEVVVLFVESSVDPVEVEARFEDADLEGYLATLERGEPLPTLREMIASGRRLLVLDQGDGGDAPWYHAGFVFVQDTRVGSLLESSAACDPGRGTPESPLVLMNHWVDDFPPPLTENRDVSTEDVLLRRAGNCRERLGRGPNMVAVDFYDRGEVLAATRTLNERPLGPRSGSTGGG